MNDKNCTLWHIPTLSHLDPQIAQSDSEVRRILDLHNVANSMLDAFFDITKVTKSHIPVANMLARINVPSRGHSATQRSWARHRRHGWWHGDTTRWHK